MAYRVPRRFIVPPDDPPPYGLLALSFAGHFLCFLMAGALSAYVNAQVVQSKIYIVNLVPAVPALGVSAPQAAPPAPTPPPAPKAPERTPPRPLEAPRPKETPPPKAETPPPKAETPPPRPRPVDEVPPPREVARATPPRPAELALPKRAEKETPALDNPATRERLVERALPPPPAPTVPTAPPTRAPTPEPPRVTTPQAPPPVPTAAVATRPVEPMRLGRPDAVTVPTTGSISLDVSDFPFTYYLRQLQAKISERWAPPRGNVAGGERVVVLFEIGRDGQIKEPAVEKSSGNALYDQSALRAVTEAGPFPPLPPEFKAPSLKVHFGFEFRPDQG